MFTLKKTSFLLLCSLLLAFFVVCVFPVAPGLAAHDEPADEFLVQFKPGTPAETRRSINANNRVRAMSYIPAIETYVMATPPGKSTRDMVHLYQKNPNVVYAEPNYTATAQVLPNDTYYPSQRGLHNIDPLGAWEITMGCSSIPIAVLDTGITFEHEDLLGRTMPGYDFVNNDADATDDRGHGTHVAGIIGAATNNSKGMAGTTWNNPLMPVKVLNSSGSGTYSGVAQGIIYAVDNGARVINMSLGGSSPSITLENAVQYAYAEGAVLVAAAGNNSGPVLYPAAYPEVIAVGAVDDDDLRASFSSYGSEISVTAPGVLVWSTRMSSSLNDYARSSGTSFAAPFVSGLAGLILSIDSSLSPAEVEAIIQQGAEDLGEPGWDPYYGWGRINLTDSLTLLGDQPPAKDTTPPEVEILSPTHGAVIEEETVIIQVAAEDESGIAKIELLIDGVSTYTATGTTSLLYPWGVTDLSEGTYTLEALAWDQVDNYAAADPVVVEIPGNDREPVPVTGVQITEGDQTIKEGETVQLTAIIEPGDADNQEITWTTSNQTVAGVSGEGLVQGLAEGVTAITVTTTDGGFTDSIEVTVYQETIAVTGVSIVENDPLLFQGETVQLTAVVEPEEAEDKRLTWSSSDETIATVTEGLVTAVLPGVTEITVVTHDGGFTDRVKVTVEQEPEPEPEPDTPEDEFKEETHSGGVGHRNQPQQLSYDFNAIGGTIELDLSWSPWRSHLGLYLYDSGGSLVAKADANTDRDAQQYISARANAETYTIVVKSIERQGNFNLVITNTN